MPPLSPSAPPFVDIGGGATGFRRWTNPLSSQLDRLLASGEAVRIELQAPESNPWQELYDSVIMWIVPMRVVPALLHCANAVWAWVRR